MVCGKRWNFFSYKIIKDVVYAKELGSLFLQRFIKPRRRWSVENKWNLFT